MRTSRACHKPPVDALAVFGSHSAALLGVGLELRLQGGELGKGRIRIGRLVALAALESRRTGRPLPIPFARRPVEPLLGLLPAVVALMTFPMRLFGRSAFRAWRRSFGLRCGNGGNSIIGPPWRALLCNFLPTRLATFEARTTRTFGPPRPAGPPDFDHDGFFGGLIRRNVGARLRNRWHWHCFNFALLGSR